MTRVIGFVALFSIVLLSSHLARAYCIGGDTCPTADSDMEVYTICASSVYSGGYAWCGGTRTVSSTDAYLGRVYAYHLAAGSYRWGYIPAICIDSLAYPLRRSTYWGGDMETASSQVRDVAMCFGSGNDSVNRASRPITCGGHSFVGWNYGAGAHWLELWGQGGDDLLTGTSGNDRVCGGTGDDNVTGASGADDVDGWTGNDICNGYDGAGDLSWGYYGNDIVADAGGQTSDAVFGEFDADDCVMVDEAYGSTGIRVNGGTANCSVGSCVCNTPADDSCFDYGRDDLGLPIGTTVGIEYFGGALCPMF